MEPSRRGKITPFVWLGLICVWFFAGLIATASFGGFAALIVVSFGFLAFILAGTAWFVARLTRDLGSRSCPQCGAGVPKDRIECPRCGRAYLAGE